MSQYAGTSLNHFKAMAALLRGVDCEPLIDPITLHLDLRVGSRRIRLLPQFVLTDRGRLRYTAQFGDWVTGFIGWLPYLGKRWPIAVDKLAFKRHCLETGIPTPPYWLGELPVGHPPVIVKSRTGSFGEGMRGPFRIPDVPVPRRLGEHEYAEEFCAGRAGKAWYWDGQLCAVEYCGAATLVGDGRATIDELLAAAAAGLPRPLDRAFIADFLRYQGIDLMVRLAAGERIPIDFRYCAPLSAPTLRADGNSNLLPLIAGAVVAAKLRQAGEACWRAIPETVRSGSLFTLDFVEDEHEQPWFLEMNCNPMVHPDVYPAILKALFGRPFQAPEPATTLAPPASALPDLPPFLEQFKRLRRLVAGQRTRAALDARDLVLHLGANGQAARLQPHFWCPAGPGRWRATSHLTADVAAFVGWYPEAVSAGNGEKRESAEIASELDVATETARQNASYVCN